MHYKQLIRQFKVPKRQAMSENPDDFLPKNSYRQCFEPELKINISLGTC